MNSVFYSSTLPQMLNVSTFYKAPKEVFVSPSKSSKINLSAGFFKIAVTYMYIVYHDH